MSITARKKLAPAGGRLAVGPWLAATAFAVALMGALVVMAVAQLAS